MNDSRTGLDLVLNRLDDLAQRIEGLYPTPWLTTAGAARYLGCSVRQVERLTDKGLLPYSRLDPTASKSSRRYHRKHLDAYLVAGKNPQSHRLTHAEKQIVKDLLG